MGEPVMKHEQKLKALVARTKALDAKITKAKAVSASHQRAIDRLVADVESYNATTKRFDISVHRAVSIKTQDRAKTLQGFDGQPVYYSHERKARMSVQDPKGCVCPHDCPASPSNPPFGFLCWLESTDCNLDCSMHVCTYRCIRIIRTPL